MTKYYNNIILINWDVIISLFRLYFNDLFDEFVLATIDINCFRHIATFLYYKFDLLFSWCSINLPLIRVDNALNRFIITISSIISTRWNCIRLILSGLLSCSWWFNAMEILLVESTIFIFAMTPVVFLEIQIVIEDILSTSHLALMPMRFIVSSLHYIKVTLG